MPPLRGLDLLSVHFPGFRYAPPWANLVIAPCGALVSFHTQFQDLIKASAISRERLRSHLFEACRAC